MTGIANALDLKTIYWHLLFPYLAEGDGLKGEEKEEGEGVDYVDFLNRYQVQVKEKKKKKRVIFLSHLFPSPFLLPTLSSLQAMLLLKNGVTSSWEKSVNVFINTKKIFLLLFKILIRGILLLFHQINLWNVWSIWIWG